MRRFLLTLLLAAATTAADAQFTRIVFVVDMGPAARAGWFDPTSELVGLRGSAEPLSWESTSKADDPDGDLRYRLDLLFADSAEPLRYKFKVDGSDNPNDGWETDRDRIVALNGGVHVVTRKFDDPPKALPRSLTGDVDVIEDVESAFLGLPRDVYVYKPPGYGTSERRYPVLYMHDGANAFDAAASGVEWRVDEAAEELIAAGEIEPVIIVGVDNTSNRIDEYTPTPRTWRFVLERSGEGVRWEGRYAVRGQPGFSAEIARTDGGMSIRLPGSEEWSELREVSPDTMVVPFPSLTVAVHERRAGQVTAIEMWRPDQGGRGADYGRFLMEELKPVIDRDYRTRPDRTAVGGSSLGGLISMYLGTLYPGRFEGLLVVSPSVWWDDSVILDYARRADLTGTRVWIDIGTAEGGGMVDGARALRDVVGDKLAADDWFYVEADGAGHNESAWAARVPDMLRFLYAKRP